MTLKLSSIILFSIMGIVGNVQAQIQLNTSDHPVVGEIWQIKYVEQDTIPTPTFGANQNWIFDNLIPLPNDLIYRFRTPSAGFLPPSNLIGYSSFDNDSTFVGFETRANGLFIKGSEDVNFSYFSSQIHLPAQMMVPFNLSLNQQVSQSGKTIQKQNFAGGEDSETQTRSTYTQTFKMVGYGTLTSLVHSNTPVLLYLEKTSSIDSFFQRQAGASELEFISLVPTLHGIYIL